MSLNFLVGQMQCSSDSPVKPLVLMPREEALKKRKKPSVSVLSVLNALKACTRLKDLEEGRRVHAVAVQNGHGSDAYVASTLVDMYAKCGRMSDARLVFDGMRRHNVVSWNALILGYADNGEVQEALDLLSRMENEGCQADCVTIIGALKACASLAEAEGDGSVKTRHLEKGIAFHCKAAELGCDGVTRVANTLMNMYAKCGAIGWASRIFHGMVQPQGVVSWNVIILGYADNGYGQQALELFYQMISESSAPNSLTFVAALKACTCLAELEQEAKTVMVADCGFVRVKARSLERGVALHSAAVASGCDSDTKLSNALSEMYGRCGSIHDARRVFDGTRCHNTVSWNVLILGYAGNGHGHEGLDLFERMLRQGPQVDSWTFVAALKACCAAADLEEGKRHSGRLVKPRSLQRGYNIHKMSMDAVCNSQVFVGNTLIDLYAKCGSMSDARSVFDDMQLHGRANVVSWNVLIRGYADNGEGQEAMELFNRMPFLPNGFTFACALKACGMVGALDSGRALHADIVARGFQHDPVIATSLIDFYGRCWSMDDAWQVFDSMSAKKCIHAWTALLACYSRHGEAGKVFDLFQRMQDEQVQPGAVTLLCVLTACSHVGLVDKAMECFESMRSSFGLSPSLEHYTCIADMLGRAGRLEDAVKLVRGMPFAPDAVTWTAILAACRKWRNLELAEMAFQSLLALDDNKDVAFVLMADVYKSKGMLQEQLQVQAMRNRRL